MMTIQKVLDALHYEGNKTTGERQCNCPAHDDNRASLSVTEGKEGRVVLHCHAGCEVAAILAAAGLTMADIMPPKKKESKKGVIVATYDYRDETGKLVYQAVRYDPKGFSQRRPDGAGGWLSNMDGVTRIPYRLRELRNRSVTDWVFICEGEKDCDNLDFMGIVATTNVGGAGKWQPSYNQHFANKRVCILPDNDDTGRKHANEVAAQLKTVAARVCIVELAGLPPKGDVSDWLKMGGTAAQLIDLANNAPEWAGDTPTHDIEDLLLSAERNDTGNATVGKVLHGSNLVYTSELGWMYRDKTHWVRDEAAARPKLAAIDTLQQRSQAIIKAMAGQDGITQALQSVVPSAKHVRDLLYLLQPMVTIDKDEFDNSPHLINTLSGVVDLRTGSVVAQESGKFTYVINAEYKPDAWLDGLYPSLMGQWFNGDQERVEYMQRALGYTVTGETREECLFWLNGERGRNGKGTMVNSIAGIMGAPLAQSVTMKAFTARTVDPQGFLLAPLHNARMAIASENSKSATMDEELIKAVTGRDGIQAAFKGRTSFNFTPKFKLWMMANSPPKGDTSDDAFWSRVRVITMPNSYLGREDNTIKDRLQSDTERAATFSWLVMGAIQWYRVGLGAPLWIQAETQRVRSEQDTVLQFADACLEASPGKNTPFAEVYHSYEQWCADAGIEPKASNNLSKELRLRGFVTDKKSVRPPGSVNPKKVAFLIDTQVVE